MIEPHLEPFLFFPLDLYLRNLSSSTCRQWVLVCPVQLGIMGHTKASQADTGWDVRPAQPWHEAEIGQCHHWLNRRAQDLWGLGNLPHSHPSPGCHLKQGILGRGVKAQGWKHPVCMRILKVGPFGWNKGLTQSRNNNSTVSYYVPDLCQALRSIHQLI